MSYTHYTQFYFCHLSSLENILASSKQFTQGSEVKPVVCQSDVWWLDPWLFQSTCQFILGQDTESRLDPDAVFECYNHVDIDNPHLLTN